MMENDIGIKNRILDAAQKQFLIYGFTKVTMDEIAAKIGMSKKTIYKFYPGKVDVVNAIADKMLAEAEEGLRNIVQDTRVGFIEKLRNMMTFVGMHLSKLSQPLIEDIRQNAPQLWEKISDYRKKSIYKNFGSLIREGRQKGVFRSDVDEHLVILIYVYIVQNIINPETISQLPLTAPQVYEHVIKVIFEGILTDGARTQIKPSTISN
jgi:AcrR family transcriptional regulator